MRDNELRAERLVRRADAYMRSALDDPAPLRSLNDITIEARQWSLAMKDHHTVLDEQFFANMFDLIADLADHMQQT